MPVESVFPQLEPLLPLVRKPVQYVGGEVNSTVKAWDEADVRWALFYPDAYEVGQPNQGIAILYEVLNEQPGVLAERTYSVWPDLEKLMRARGIPQFTVDAHRPVSAFDVLGVSFSTELGYTNLLTALDLAGVPLIAADRTTAHPIVLAGGHAAFNPEPWRTSLTRWSSGTARKPCSPSPASSVSGSRAAARAGATASCSSSPRPAASTSRSSTT